jgi:hypothetical protein
MESAPFLHQDRQVRFVDKQSVTLPSRYLTQDAEKPHVLQGFRHGWSRDSDLSCSRWDRDDRILLHILEDRRTEAAGRPRASICRRRSRLGPLSRPGKKEIEAHFPISLDADAIQVIVAGSAVSLEVEA